jgi:hypothetical protein
VDDDDADTDGLPLELAVVELVDDTVTLAVEDEDQVCVVVAVLLGRGDTELDSVGVVDTLPENVALTDAELESLEEDETLAEGESDDELEPDAETDEEAVVDHVFEPVEEAVRDTVTDEDPVGVVETV